MSRPRRARCFETLSDRRLLAVAEGAVVDVASTIELEGLAGEISGTWSWGDGTTSPAIVSGGQINGNVSIRFDYSLDTGNFFADPQRRAVLQAAADSITARLGDNLSAIQVDSPHLTWTPSVIHPSQGGSNPENQVSFNLATNPRVNAGEIVIFVGSRPFSGNTAGLGGAGGNGIQFGFSASSQEEANRFQAAIDADIREIQSRGQAGAFGDSRTDVAPSFGSIAFNSDSARYYFGVGEIAPNQSDFFAVAQHELAHVLGFGEARGDIQTSWENLLSAGRFAGDKATAIYNANGGTGNIPLSASNHWASSLRDSLGIRTILTPRLVAGSTASFAPLDFAVLDDIGWEVQTSTINATGSHRYGDNGVYVPVLNLVGSVGGSQSSSLDSIAIENALPVTAAVAVGGLFVGDSVSTRLATFTDTGFGNAQADPPTAETFTASIDWADGTIDAAVPTISNAGGPGQPASGFVSGTHTYTEPGTYRVIVTISDDDRGASTSTTLIDVFTRTEFQNSNEPFDVNADGEIEPVDALRVINEIRRRQNDGASEFLDPRNEPVPTDGFVDVDGDGFLRPLDILLVINELRRQQFEPEAIDQVMLDELDERKVMIEGTV